MYSHLDYCNSLLYNLSDRDIEKLQRVYNCLAYVVCKAYRFSRSKPLLISLNFFLCFKLCTITFKALLFQQPTYLFKYLVPVQNSRMLRSSNTNMLTVPRFRTKWGVKRFCSCSSLHLEFIDCRLSWELRVQSPHLKKMLKAFLFDSAPPPPNFSEIRRPVDDLRFDSQHWADFDLDYTPLSSYLWGFRCYRSYRIDWLNWLISKQVNGQ